jgi:hypothetical protein
MYTVEQCKVAQVSNERGGHWRVLFSPLWSAVKGGFYYISPADRCVTLLIITAAIFQQKVKNTFSYQKIPEMGTFDRSWDIPIESDYRNVRLIYIYWSTTIGHSNTRLPTFDSYRTTYNKVSEKQPSGFVYQTV